MKRKKLLCGILTAVLIGSLPAQVFAEGRVVWKENQTEIHVGRTGFQNYYDICYLNTESGQLESDYVYGFRDSISLLMIDGGFVPFSRILIDEKGAIHVSFEDLKEPLGLELLQGEDVGVVTLKNENGKELVLRYVESQMTRLEDEVYVPLRLTAEFFGCEVKYIPDYQKEFCNEGYSSMPKIHIITVETPQNQEKTYTREEAMLFLQKAAGEVYERYVNTMQASGMEYQEYDSGAIVDSGKELGRYFVYQLESFADIPIYINRYTGEIYSQNPMSTLISISDGLYGISRALY